jgi:hypothetical protein
MLLFTLLVTLAPAVSAQAQQYGWAPPNYSVTGVRNEDGYHYRNLRQVLHDHCIGWRLGQHRARKAGLDAWEQGGLPAARLLSPMTTLPPPSEGPNLLVFPRPAAAPPDIAPQPELVPPPDIAPENDHAGSSGH